MWSSIEVIPYTLEKTIRDSAGRVVERAGDVVVSHGICHVTLKKVCLPCEPFDQFVRAHCIKIGFTWYLKE